MTMTSIAAPPFHVSSSAAEVRNGFPYFAYHESVSALWQQKWRPSCVHGVYPFSDGKVEDFDLIFEELIRLSGDRTEMLYRPDEYAKPFLPVGDNLVQMAERAEAQGDTSKARELYLRAATVYRLARSPINRSPVSQQAWEKGKAAYAKAGQYMMPANVPVDVPFTHAALAAGDRDAPIHAYLRIPHGEKPKEGWPIVLFICGLDGYRTDQTDRVQKFADRGFATLTFEIPGTGDCPAAANDPNAADRLLDSVLDWVSGNSAGYGFDLKKILAQGVSTGGYYAMRAAHTHADRLFAAVAQGGACHFMFDPEWIQASNQMEYPFALAEALAYKFGFRGSEPVAAYAADGHQFSLLSSGVLDRPSCKLLMIGGMEDSIFPAEDSFLVESKGNNKDLIVRGNRSHMGEPGAEKLIFDWIDNTMAGKP